MQIHGAQLANIHSNQIELTEEFHATHKLSMVLYLRSNSHSEALQNVRTDL